ncbi:BRCA1-A complex subunit BRE [Gryllus bimaculatus]|nr:BRCA1-A complex subunit BRE [Gryllus bimaculatus]
MNEQIVSSFHPNIQPFVKELLVNGNVDMDITGIGGGNLKIAEVQSGRPTIETSGSGDRFKLSIPFAGQFISWEIIFNSYRKNYPPDFTFNDETFLSDPDVDILEKHLPSLANWNSQDPKALYYVISELLVLYRKHQVNLLDELDYSRIQFEYLSLVRQAQVSEDDVEVLVGNRNKSRFLCGAVNFLIRLKVDFSGLPPVLSTENPGENVAILLVTFHSPEGSRITPQLHLSPGVEKALGGAGTLQLPPFPPDGSCLMDYVPIVVDQLQERVANVTQCYEKKKEYLAALFYHLEKSILEYDGVTFSHASFMLERRDFYFLLHVTLPLYFPKEKPTFQFQSVYHARYGNPYQTRCDDYPFSPRWDISEMVERACQFITEYAEIFQKNSIQSVHN